MPILQTPHEKKSAVKTTIIMVLLILSFFYVGMTYLDPPEEMGVEVNFGTSDVGSGSIQPLQTKQPKPQPTTPQETTPQEINTPKEEDILTQEEDAPIAVPEPEEKPKVKPKPEPKPTPKPKPIPKPKPDASTTSALDNLIGAPSNTNNNSTGDGEGGGAGDQGKIDGNPYATSYYGGGTGNGSGYGLNGRNKQSNNKFIQDCNEEGRVVVKITVNQQGKVTSAIPGVRGTTNTASCLMDPAKKTALSYRFNVDNKAPSKQIGFVVINFILGE